MSDDRPEIAWRRVRLGDVCLVNPDKRDAAWPHEEIEYIDISSVGTGVITTPPARLPVSKAPSRAQRLVRRGDTIIATVRPNLRSFVYMSATKPNTVVSTGFAVLRATGDSDERFIYYVVSDQSFTNYLAARAHGSAYPAVSVAVIRDAKLLLPPLDVQRAIGELLGSLDDKIDQNRRMAQSLERMMREIFRSWFVDFEPMKAKAGGATAYPSIPQPVFDALATRFVKSELDRVPEGWEVKAIGDVVSVKGGATPSTKNPEYWEGGIHYWATPRDMSRLSLPVLLETERRITDAGVACISSGLLPIGTVLLSSRAPVGYLAVAAVPTAINQGFIAMICDGPLPPVYILNWTYQSLDAIRARASGTTFPEISKSSFRPMQVVVPPEAVVSAFKDVADPLFDLLVAAEKESLRLAALRDYLLPRLLTGSVTVEVRNG